MFDRWSAYSYILIACSLESTVFIAYQVGVCYVKHISEAPVLYYVTVLVQH